MGEPANDGDLEAGPGDVIVSADDTGLVTVTYGQADGESADDPRPPGATSPAVIWDGDSDQQIIIFKEGEAPVVSVLGDLVPPVPPSVLAESEPPEAANEPAGRTAGPSDRQPPTEERLFYCDVCDASFTSTDGLAAHRQGHDRLRFRCAFCPERCATTVALSRHMNEAHAARLLPCASCEKRFASRAGLAQHAKQHEARQHGCTQCPRRFVSLHDLQLHVTFKHSDARPFSCEVCRRTFKTASMVRRHKLRHTGLKPHRCALCGLSFTHKFAMENHVATHASHRHECATCGKKFAQRRSAEQHVRLMHSGVAFAAS
ncbi:oocyte zinc finger protein XlCOF19-like isoform X2 [Pollicipes pollicipes]|nr:oocyte zinc finger protein XlCOF19-like isoform X2 [Pollicipes pollicipes]